MSLASETRAAVRANPFLLAALRAGVLNYAAAARFVADQASLSTDADVDAVASALRRYEADLPAFDSAGRSVRVTMQSRLGPDEDDPLLVVGDRGFAAGAGSLTGVLATGDVDATALGAVLSRLLAESVAIEAAGVGGDALLVVVERRDGPDALRFVEAALDAVPR